MRNHWPLFITLALCACDASQLQNQPDLGEPDSGAVIDTTPVCVPCVVDVGGAEWHVSAAMDFYVRTTRGRLEGRSIGDVCRATYNGVPLAGTWTVADDGTETGFPIVERSDSPQTCSP